MRVINFYSSVVDVVCLVRERPVSEDRERLGAFSWRIDDVIHQMMMGDITH